MPLPTDRRRLAAPALTLVIATMFVACASNEPPLLKRVEKDGDPPAQAARAPIVLVVPKPAHGADQPGGAAGPSAAPSTTRGLQVPGTAVAAPDSSTIYFGRDRYQVDDQYAPLLQAHAKRLLSDPGLTLRIDAFTDRSGPAEYNLELSRMRAQTVQRQLRALGVPARQLQVVGHGPVRGGGGNPRRVELNYR